MAMQNIELSPCLKDSDTCAICPRLYYFFDGKRTFDRECRRYPTLGAQKEAIKNKFSGHTIRFEGES